jgi:hypothetical protein
MLVNRGGQRGEPFYREISTRGILTAASATHVTFEVVLCGILGPLGVTVARGEIIKHGLEGALGRGKI